ncbi:hypothetical protein [uncultured Rikenella sp.]|uniref:hypothetical protein n=2 Tax=uncultured Rikenella sp. TaxID=368003 RepID=UPI00262CAD66|nr:hypothetical protein [uncultured Rikenella sp.]
MNETTHTKRRAAATLLERGVRVQCVSAPLLIRLFGCRQLSITLRQPTLAELIRISEIVVGMGLNPDDLDHLTLEKSYGLLQAHGRAALQILAIAARRRGLPRRWFARWLGRHLTPAAFAEAWMVFMLTAGVSDFIGSIRLMTTVDNLSPNVTANQPAE